jgi:hypothetical protein
MFRSNFMLFSNHLYKIKETGVLPAPIAIRSGASSVSWFWLCESQTVEKRKITDFVENLLHSSITWTVSLLTATLVYYSAHQTFRNLYLSFNRLIKFSSAVKLPISKWYIPHHTNYLGKINEATWICVRAGLNLPTVGTGWRSLFRSSWSIHFWRETSVTDWAGTLEPVKMLCSTVKPLVLSERLN